MAAVVEDARVETTSLECIHISLWFEPAEVADVDRLAVEMDETIARHGRVAVLLVVDQGVPLSPDASRRRALQVLRDRAEDICGVGIVIGSAGFLGSSVRAMFVGLGLLLRPRFPWSLFGDVESAADWVRDRVGFGAPSAAELGDAISLLEGSRR